MNPQLPIADAWKAVQEGGGIAAASLKSNTHAGDIIAAAEALNRALRAAAIADWEVRLTVEVKEEALAANGVTASPPKAIAYNVVHATLHKEI